MREALDHGRSMRTARGALLLVLCRDHSPVPPRASAWHPGGAIAPTPEIGVVGLLEDISLLVRPPFTTTGDTVMLVGQTTPGLAGSAYATLAGRSPAGRPPSGALGGEAATQALITEAQARVVERK